MVHKTKVEKYNGTLKSLAKDIGNLRYDSLTRFLGYLSEKIRKDSDKDRIKYRVFLAEQLRICSIELSKAENCADSAWRICKPKMK